MITWDLCKNCRKLFDFEIHGHDTDEYFFLNGFSWAGVPQYLSASASLDYYDAKWGKNRGGVAALYVLQNQSEILKEAKRRKLRLNFLEKCFFKNVEVKSEVFF